MKLSRATELSATTLDDVTSALRNSSVRLRSSARGNYASLFKDSAAGKRIFDSHEPQQPFEGRLQVVRLVSNKVTGRERTEWRHSLGLDDVTRFPQHVVEGDDLRTLLRINAPFVDLRHALLPTGGRGVKDVFSVEVEAPQKRMDSFLASFRKGGAKGNSVIRGKTKNSWIFVTGDETLLKKFVGDYARKFGKPLGP